MSGPFQIVGGRRRAVALASLVVLAVSACTGEDVDDSGAPADDVQATPGGSRPEALVLGVVASETGPTAESDRTYLDGMRLAAGEINEGGGVAGLEVRLRVLDDGGRSRATSRALSRLLREVPAVAHLAVGSGSAVAGQRPAIEEAGAPILLLGGDLYTPRALFRQVFQTGVPARWQARVTARYLVRDRRHRRILLVHEPGADGARSRDAFAAALREEGVSPARIFPMAGGGAPAGLVEAARGADAVVVIGSAESAAAIAGALAGLAEPPQLALSSDSLRSDSPGPLPPGAVAPYPYAWAGWARPIRRVERFIRRFERAFGRAPVGFEQEGYDAVRLLGDALARTEGRGGEPLVRALESNRPRGPLFSGLPLVLGPDDHTLTDETFVGLFAVAGPDEQPEPWVAGIAWRPIVRTFTFDGQRTSFLERDRRVFFPSWRRGRPSPKFGRSRYGITTRAAEDPVH